MIPDGPLYVRYGGDVPESGRSSVWSRGEMKVGEESGVSVYEAYRSPDGEFVPVPPRPLTDDALDDYLHFLKYAPGTPVYLVAGVPAGKGTDGEPVLSDVRTLARLDWRTFSPVPPGAPN